jgi:hypothetical protein
MTAQLAEDADASATGTGGIACCSPRVIAGGEGLPAGGGLPARSRDVVDRV